MPRRSLFRTMFSHGPTNNSPSAASHNKGEGRKPSSLSQSIKRSSAPSPGQVKRRIYKSTGRESRIAALEIEQQSHQETWSDSKQAELNGLLRASSKFEEPYDETLFDDDHTKFKQLHNEAFLALIRYCQERRLEQRMEEEENKGDEEGVSAFFLDGPTGGTASVLIQGGLDPSQCFVANRHEATCQKLRISGGGKLLEGNVVHASAAEALRRVNGGSGGTDDDDGTTIGLLGHLDFAAYYFDGCGGYAPQIVDMISAALVRNPNDKENIVKTTAIGFSLMGGNKDVVHKEMSICQAVNKIAKKHNMRMWHVMDDPGRYGISNDITKVGGAEGQTFTTWLILEMDR